MMKKILIPIGILLVNEFAYGQLSPLENYVQIKTYLDYPAGQNAKVEETVQYFDGLGRSKQIVSVKSAPSGKDLVVKVPYDEFGRKVDTWFPVPMNSLNGGIQSGVDGQAAAFYGDSFSFSHLDVEKSPLDRILSKKKPGLDWQSHPVQYNYDTNGNGDSVKKLITLSTWPDNATKSIVKTGDTLIYSTGQLTKTSITDEDGNVIIEFKNGSGQIILRRKVLSPTENADTYYVYNEYNQLAFIIPPNAAFKFFQEMSAGGDEEIPSDILNSLCYQYRYDNKSRLVEKKLPGKGWEYMVYDRQDRLVLTQDANLGAEKKWLFKKYDQFGRVVYTGIYTSTQNYNSTGRSAEQANVDARGSNNTSRTYSNSTVGFTSTGMDVYYYNNSASYPNSITSLLTINYYDSYPLYSFNPPTPSNAVKDDFVLKKISTKGFPVMSFVKNIEDDRWTKNYMYYDVKGRPISRYSINYQDGYTKTESELNFAGLATHTTTTHKLRPSNPEVVINESFIYDNQNRLIVHKHKVGNNTEEILTQNTYNDILQLSNKKVGGTISAPLQDIDYKYNIHGLLTQINNTNDLNSKLFAYSIKYQNPENNVSGPSKFNGLISEIDWRTSNDDTKRRYGFQYDKLNRLLKATYSKPTITTAPGEHYNESATYDINGNIKTMLRFGGTDNGNKMRIDDIAYTYSGNQLSDVWDSSGNGLGLDGGDMMGYDDNGNMISDNAHFIYKIKYNHLNLPYDIERFEGAVTYIYSAYGEKLSSMNIMTETNEITTRDYIDAFQYENGILQFIPTSEGYYDFVKNKYIYNYTDHLGNIRLSYTKNANGTGVDVLSENNYYPFGLRHEGYNNLNGNSSYKYMFNGKELQDTKMYDYGARFYMPDIGRWGVVDPLAEKYPEMTPFRYSFNNPINANDPTGMVDDWYNDSLGNVSWHDSQEDQITGSNGETLNRLGKSGSYVNVNGGLTVLNENGTVTEGGVTSLLLLPSKMSNAAMGGPIISTKGFNVFLSSFDTTKYEKPSPFRLPSPALMDPSAKMFRYYVDYLAGKSAFNGLRSILLYKPAPTALLTGSGGGALEGLGVQMRIPLGTTRVGHWSPLSSYNQMVASGSTIVEDGGMTFFAIDGPNGWNAAPKGWVYSEMDIPSSALIDGGQANWLKAVHPEAGGSQMYLLQKQGGFVTPPAFNITPPLITK
ncbi:DUF6443 domain-containing protein [Chryseobacterium cucumeris]|uniref:DUF6443 domain-containing protein n=1 Tax=Chryseobacterium cucumeris TaxID=1813611 RepID=UPI00192D65BB|nr:DUF6443 domain-containing protein [Chryseobacterium cucumeris]QRA41366.1 RHS repeat-associated core domain-containing protein [Chryseobacterium cucumeris]